MTQPLRIGLPSFDQTWKLAAPRNSKEPARRPMSLMDSTFLLRLQTLKTSLGLDPMIQNVIPKISNTMKSFEGVLVANPDDLSEVPLGEIAPRIEPFQTDDLPSLEAIESADGLEIQLEDQTLRPGLLEAETSVRALSIAWPVDVSSLQLLQKKIDFFRSLFDSPIPVGISLPMTSSPDHLLEDFGWLSELTLDFITVRTPQALLHHSCPAVSLFPNTWFAQIELFRGLLDDAERSTTRLWIDHPWSNGYEAARAMLVGANGVYLHAYLSQYLKKRLSEFTFVGDDPLLGTAEQLQGKRRVAAKILEWLAEWDSNNPIQRFVAEFRAFMELASSGKILKP